MNNDFQDLLADTSEVILDSLLENDIVKEIPILGSSIKIIRGIKSLRDRAYLNKIKIFLERIGEINEKQRRKLIEDSRQNEKSRAKFGDAIFTAIEQSDSTVKIEYLAVAFEAFTKDEIDESLLRLLCHIIRNTFSDELTDIIENEKPILELKYAVASGLAETTFEPIKFDSNGEPNYSLSNEANVMRMLWKKYGKKES